MLEQTVQVINPCYISNLYIFQQYKNMGELYSSVYQVSHNPSYLSPTFTTTFLFSQVPTTSTPFPTLPPHIFSFLPFLHSQLPPFLLSIPNYLLFFSYFSTTSPPSFHSQLPHFLISIPNYLPSFFPFPTTSLPSFSSFPTTSFPSLPSQLPPFLLLIPSYLSSMLHHLAKHV